MDASEEPLHPRPADPLPEPRGKPRSELLARVLTAAVLVPTVIYVIVLGGLPFLAVVVLFTVLGLREFYGLLDDKGASPIVSYGLAAGAALPVVAYIGTEYHATLILTATMIGVMVRSVGRAQITEALASISGTFMGVFYVGWLLSHVVVLRNFHHAASSKYGVAAVDSVGVTAESGIFFVLFCLVAVVWSDAGAYFAGRAWGRRKLAPKISPGKTVEGAIGGVLGGTAAALLTKAIFDMFWPDLSQALLWGPAVAMGMMVAVVAIVGDLAESLMKRDAQTKDAGSLLPGMGGILDRIDSPLLGIPVMYYMLLFYVFLMVESR